MTRFQLAYRHENGEVEGFAALAFGAQAAEEQAKAAVRRKVESIGQTFDNGRLITSDKGQTRAEKDTIRADWKLVRNPGDPDPASGRVGFFG